LFVDGRWFCTSGFDATIAGCAMATEPFYSAS
jgi:hypothetical protein